MRRADAAQVCSDVGFVSVDGEFECSFALAARQIESERWREGEGLKEESPAPRSEVSFRLNQKTGNLKMTIVSRVMQWSALSVKKQKNELAHEEFRFIKTITIIRGRGAITCRPSPPHQRCEARRIYCHLGMNGLCRFIFGFGLSYILIIFCFCIKKTRYVD